MLSRTFLLAAFATTALTPFAIAQPMAHATQAGIGETLTLEHALELATLRSESARSARAAIAGATQSALAAGQLPDPMLRAGVDNLPVTGADRLSTTRDSMTMKRIGISQEWVSADKRTARRAAAQAAVGQESAQLLASLAETRLQTALAFLDAFYAEAALELTRLMEHHAREEFEAARARLASAGASSPEVVALSAARAMARDDSTEVQQQQAAAEIALQRWAGVSANDLSPPPELSAMPEDAFVDGHPAVLGRQQAVQVARLEAELTAANRRPNWTWEASYGQRTGYSDMLSVGVSIPLPIAPADRQDRDTAAKLALVEKAQGDLAEARRAAQSEHAGLLRNTALLDARIDQYRDGVLLLAQQRVVAATAAYRSNQGTLVNLFEARRAEVDAQRKLLALQRDLARTKAQLAYRASPAAREVP